MFDQVVEWANDRRVLTAVVIVVVLMMLYMLFNREGYKGGMMSNPVPGNPYSAGGGGLSAHTTTDHAGGSAHLRGRGSGCGCGGAGRGSSDYWTPLDDVDKYELDAAFSRQTDDYLDPASFKHMQADVNSRQQNGGSYLEKDLSNHLHGH